MAPKFAAIPNSPNLQRAFQLLTDGTASSWSGGKLAKMTPIQAAGFLGALTHEHGKWDWSGLDVIERGSGRGRGAIQATDNWDGSPGRRTAYEAARKAAISRGEDPNSVDFQIRYIAEEYAGKWDHTVGGKSLSGWTRALSPGRIPNFKNVQEAVMYYTGSADEGKGYLRPKKATAHYDRRIDAARQIQGYVQKWTSPKQEAPATTAPAAGGTQKGGSSNFLQEALKKLGIKGGAQSFNTNKLQRVVGSIAANTPVRDIGFAIFSATKGGTAKAWKNLDNNTRRAYGKAGASLAISTNPSYQVPRNPYSLPKSLSIGSGSQNYGTNVGPKATFDSKIDLSRNSTTSPGPRDIGGLPGLGDIAQAGIANYKYFKDKANSYNQAAFSKPNSTYSNINNRSYGTSLDLGRSLGISGSAAGAAARAGGSSYGGAAFSSSFNAGSIASSSYGYSS